MLKLPTTVIKSFGNVVTRNYVQESFFSSSVPRFMKNHERTDRGNDTRPPKINKARKINDGHTDREAKLISFRSKITDHDLESKVNHMKKWLKKGIPIKATISNVESTMEKCEELYTKIGKQISEEGKLAQKQQSGKDIKFVVEPKESSS